MNYSCQKKLNQVAFDAIETPFGKTDKILSVRLIG
jgi:hypothetical protein